MMGRRGKTVLEPLVLHTLSVPYQVHHPALHWTCLVRPIRCTLDSSVLSWKLCRACKSISLVFGAPLAHVQCVLETTPKSLMELSLGHGWWGWRWGAHGQWFLFMAEEVGCHGRGKLLGRHGRHMRGSLWPRLGVVTVNFVRNTSFPSFHMVGGWGDARWPQLAGLAANRGEATLDFSPRVHRYHCKIKNNYLKFAIRSFSNCKTFFMFDRVCTRVLYFDFGGVKMFR
jgi:hypothetical protein